MGLRDRSSPTILGRWFEGQWKPTALRIGGGFVICILTLPIMALAYGFLEGTKPKLRDLFTMPPDDPVGSMALLTVIGGCAYTFWLIRFTGTPKFRQMMVDASARGRLDERLGGMGLLSFGGAICSHVIGSLYACLIGFCVV